MSVRIITDSTCALSFEEADALGVKIVPLRTLFGQDAYREGIDLSPDEFYTRLIESKTLPTTSQPSPDDFLTVFESSLDAGDSALVITLSHKLSGTLQSARIAADMHGGDIHTIDSLGTIGGQRILVEHACRLRDEGKDAATIVRSVEAVRSRLRLLAIVDTLEYFYKGGRLSRSQAILGSLLSMKPIVTLKAGSLSVLSKARGTKAALSTLVDQIKASRGIDSEFPVYLGYTQTPDKCTLLSERIQKEFGVNGPFYPIGCVIGTHAGPGACAISYVENE